MQYSDPGIDIDYHFEYSDPQVALNSGPNTMKLAKICFLPVKLAKTAQN